MKFSFFFAIVLALANQGCVWRSLDEKEADAYKVSFALGPNFFKILDDYNWECPDGDRKELSFTLLADPDNNNRFAINNIEITPQNRIKIIDLTTDATFWGEIRISDAKIFLIRKDDAANIFSVNVQLVVTFSDSYLLVYDKVVSFDVYVGAKGEIEKLVPSSDESYCRDVSWKN